MADGGMDFSEVKGVLDGVKSAFEVYKQKNDEALKERVTKGDVDVLLKEQLERIDTSLNAGQERLDRFEAAMKRKTAKVLDENGEEVDLDKKAREWATLHAGKHPHVAEGYNAGTLAEYKTAFGAFLRKEEAALSMEERKALTVGSDPNGGYLVTPDTSGRIVGFVYETSPIRQYATTVMISSDAHEGIADLNEVSASWVGETQTRSETTTPALNKWRIVVHEMAAMPKASQKMLDDAATDVEGWLSAKVADKFSRAENAAFVNGTGVTQPRGFLTFDNWTTAGTFEYGKIEQFGTGANGAFAAAPNGGDVLLDALYGLKDSYRSRAVWAMNRTTLKMVRKLKDSDGAYLWAPGIQAGQPSSLLGYPLASFEDMPNGTTTGALAIAIADWREAYTIVDRMGIRVLRDPFTAKPYVLFYTTKRVGGSVVNFEALKLVKFS